MSTEFSIPTTGAHADFIAELLNALTLPQQRESTIGAQYFEGDLMRKISKICNRLVCSYGSLKNRESK